MISENDDDHNHDLGPWSIANQLVDCDPTVDHLLDDDFLSSNSCDLA